jgi:hypothetical protein
LVNTTGVNRGGDELTLPLGPKTQTSFIVRLESGGFQSLLPQVRRRSMAATKGILKLKQFQLKGK